MKDEYNSFDVFLDHMRTEHNKLGTQKGYHMLHNATLSEAWEEWAANVQDAISGANPQVIKSEMVKLANKCMYVHEMLEREDNKSAAYKLAEARKERMNSFEPRRV